jgi:hypothetical protein
MFFMVKFIGGSTVAGTATLQQPQRFVRRVTADNGLDKAIYIQQEERAQISDSLARENQNTFGLLVVLRSKNLNLLVCQS